MLANQIHTEPNTIEQAKDRPYKTPTVGKLAEALAKAQGEIQDAEKNKLNPHFKSAYADLASVWDACRDALSKNSLAVTQIFTTDIPTGRILLITELMHSSGESIRSIVPISPRDNTPQAVGSAMTYMRRFALSAMVGVAPSEKPTEDDVDDDDDGNAATTGPTQVQKVQPKVVHETKSSGKMLTEPQVDIFWKLAKSANLSSDQITTYLFGRFGHTDPAALPFREYTLICNTMRSKKQLPEREDKAATPPASNAPKTGQRGLNDYSDEDFALSTQGNAG